MTRLLGSLTVAATLLAAPLPAGAAPTQREALQSVGYLVGTWSCAHTVGDFSGVYTTAYAPDLGGTFLKQTYAFPASASEPAIRAEYFITYEARGKTPHWVRFGAHSNGMYFGMVTTADAGGVWKWRYVLPGNSPEPDLTWTKRSETEYALDGPTYPQNGKLVTEHHVCKKTP